MLGVPLSGSIQKLFKISFFKLFYLKFIYGLLIIAFIGGCSVKKRTTEFKTEDLGMLSELSNLVSKYIPLGGGTANTEADFDSVKDGQFLSENIVLGDQTVQDTKAVKIPKQELEKIQKKLNEVSANNSEAVVHKYFFYDYNKSGRHIGYKTFSCGWVRDSVAIDGRYFGITQTKGGKSHCNILFKILEDKLVGYIVNPSKLEEPLDNWGVYITIPVKDHLYVEKKKDGNGRELNEYTEESRRSDWSARPFVKLDLSGIEVWSRGNISGDKVVTTFDVEWDYVNNFFAFTNTFVDKVYSTFFVGNRWFSRKISWLMGTDQANIRFNFLGYDHDKTFTKTPYDFENTQHLNVLHVLGKKITTKDGVYPESYAAHWDTRKKHVFTTYDCKDEYYGVIEDVFENWNDAFEAIGNGRPFEVEKANRKYAFDMRYNSVICINDYELSSRAPLGVGIASTDVRNGNILWGAVTVWTGNIDRIVDSNSSYTESSLSGAVSSYDQPVNLSLAINDETYRNELLPASGMSASYLQEQSNYLNSPMHYIKAHYNFMVAGMALRNLDAEFVSDDDNITSESEEESSNDESGDLGISFNLLGNLQWDENLLMDVVESGQSVTQYLSATSGISFASSFGSSLTEQISALKNDLYFLSGKSSSSSSSIGSIEEELNVFKPEFSPLFDNFTWNSLLASDGLATMQDIDSSFYGVSDEFSRDDILNSIRGDYLQNGFVSNELMASPDRTFVFDLDRTMESVGGEWASGVQALIAEGKLTKTQAKLSFFKDLMLHEVGHVLGCGHNFKENILPEAGTVPDLYIRGANVSDVKGYVPLPKSADGSRYLGLEERAKRNYSNYTTVMGYKHGFTDVQTPYEELMPGPMDVLVLEYLYNQRVPYYPVSATGKEVYKWRKLTEDGKIDEVAKFEGESDEWRPGYFQACNDVESTIGVDPYCNRWDRGYDAPTIVENHYEDLKSMVASVIDNYSNVSSISPERLENYLLSRSLRHNGRSRLFYDYMRDSYKYLLEKSDFAVIRSVGNSNTMSGLVNFSKVCTQVYLEKFPEDAKLLSGLNSIKKSLNSSSSSSNEDSSTESLSDSSGDPAIENLRNIFENNDELTKLCVASVIMFKQLDDHIKIAGPDVTETDTSSRFFPGSITGGDTQRKSKPKGDTLRLSRLPLKISTILTLTLPYPVVNRYGSLVPAYSYTRQNARYHLSTLYPNEYTRVVSNGVTENLFLGDDTTEPYIGKAILYLGYLLNYRNASEDKFILPDIFKTNIHDKTRFDFFWAYVNVQKKKNDDVSETEAFEFDATVTAFKRSATRNSNADVYLYTQKRVINQPNDTSLLLPVSSPRWTGQTSLSYYALKLEFGDDYYDYIYETKNVRSQLTNLYETVTKRCIEGRNKNGLNAFFKYTPERVFEGFEVNYNIQKGGSPLDQFYQSLEESFTIYESNMHTVDGNEKKILENSPNLADCDKALKIQEILVYGSLILNGQYSRGMMDFFHFGGS